MLNPHARARGFSMIAVTGALIIIGLLMMAAWHLVQDHRRRATLSADRALALQAAELALTAAECELAIATHTPGYTSCTTPVTDARAAALDPITLSGFTPGVCGQGLCWPLEGQSVLSMVNLTGQNAPPNAVTLRNITTMGQRQLFQATRYVIEPIPDAQPGQWMHAGAERLPALFRITAVGFGADPDIYVMLQTVYRPQVNVP